jgi:hypothetical protein
MLFYAGTIRELSIDTLVAIASVFLSFLLVVILKNFFQLDDNTVFIIFSVVAICIYLFIILIVSLSNIGDQSFLLKFLINLLIFTLAMLILFAIIMALLGFITGKLSGVLGILFGALALAMGAVLLFFLLAGLAYLLSSLFNNFKLPKNPNDSLENGHNNHKENKNKEDPAERKAANNDF